LTENPETAGAAGAAGVAVEGIAVETGAAFAREDFGLLVVEGAGAVVATGSETVTLGVAVASAGAVVVGATSAEMASAADVDETEVELSDMEPLMVEEVFFLVIDISVYVKVKRRSCLKFYFFWQISSILLDASS
jgi:hypothetical protein